MSDVPDNLFEMVGDPDALSDEFFDSLAGLLIAIVDAQPDTGKESKSEMQVVANTMNASRSEVQKAG